MDCLLAWFVGVVEQAIQFVCETYRYMAFLVVIVNGWGQT